jgi:probable F420-dependent oxidoreductase
MGLGITYASLQSLGPSKAIDVARRAQELGYSSFWTAEVTGPEAFTTLAAAGAAAPSLGLGTGVVPLQVRTPMLAAMAAATLQELHPGVDVHLGVGISSLVVATQWHGAAYSDRPLAQVREYVDVLRAIFGGEPVTFDGDFYRLRRSRLGVRLGERTPKIVLAALNPAMLRLAGEVADGVLLNYLPAGHVPWSIDQVRQGERHAGRPAGSTTVHAYVHVGVGDRESARPLARRDLFSYSVVDAYARNFERAGFGAEVAAIRERFRAGDRAGAEAEVSDRMVDAIDVVGDTDEVAVTIRAYLEAGVDNAIVMPLPWGEDRWATLESTMEAAARPLP